MGVLQQFYFPRGGGVDEIDGAEIDGLCGAGDGGDAGGRQCRREQGPVAL